MGFYRDAKGNWVIKPMSTGEFLGDFEDDRTVMERDGKSGIVDRTGTWVAAPTFDSIYQFRFGFAPAQQGGKWGFIDRNGSWVIKPVFEEASGFGREGLVVVTYDAQDWMIDRKGNRRFGDRFQKLLGFSGESWAQAESGDKWGAVDTAGNWILQPIYECVGLCEDAFMVPAPPPRIDAAG